MRSRQKPEMLKQNHENMKLKPGVLNTAERLTRVSCAWFGRYVEKSGRYDSPLGCNWFLRISNIEQIRTFFSPKPEVVDKTQLLVNKIPLSGQKSQQNPKNNAIMRQD